MPRILWLLVATVCMCQQAVALTYQIHPVVYDNGYELTGGTITTDGTLGLILPENIVAYSATITGPNPHMFNSSSSTSGILIFNDVVATATEIVVPVRETMSGIETNGLVFLDSDLPASTCPDCTIWQQWTNGYIRTSPSSYRSLSLVGVDFRFNTSAPAPRGGGVVYSPQRELVVAIVIPEPTTCTLALVGLCMTMRRRRV